jgi:uncharacterized membrane protein
MHVLCSAATYTLGLDSAALHEYEVSGCIVATALSIKLVTSIILFIIEPIPGLQSRQSARIADLYESKWTMLYTCVPGFCYTSSDVLLLYVQQGMAMTQVQVISKLGIPVATLMWVCVFQSRVTRLKLFGLLLILAGSSIYEIRGSGFDLLSWKFNIQLWCLFAQIILSNAASVSCELLLTQHSGSLSLQNAGIYGWGLVLLASTGHIHLDQIRNLPRMASTVACLFALLGLTTAGFLKYLGNMWKQVSYGSMLIVYCIIDAVAFNNIPGMVNFIGIYVVLTGTCLCIYDGFSAACGCNTDDKQ